MTIAMSNDHAPAEPAQTDPEGWGLVEALVQRRKELGLRQVDVAERMHVGQSSVCQIETGHAEPRLSTLVRYARAVGADLRMRLDYPDDDGV